VVKASPPFPRMSILPAFSYFLRTLRYPPRRARIVLPSSIEIDEDPVLFPEDSEIRTFFPPYHGRCAFLFHLADGSFQEAISFFASRRFNGPPISMASPHVSLFPVEKYTALYHAPYYSPWYFLGTRDAGVNVYSPSLVFFSESELWSPSLSLCQSIFFF